MLRHLPPPRPHRRQPPLRTGRVLLAITVIAIMLRVSVALYLGDATPPGKDETSYSTLAARLATGHGYSFPTEWYPFTPANAPTSHWSFLYAAFAAGLYAVFGPHPLAARLAGALLSGMLTPWLLYRLTRAMLCESPAPGTSSTGVVGPISGLPTTLPLLAAGLGSIYAYFVLYGAMVQTEALFICALLWSLERALALQRAWSGRGARVEPLVIGLSLGVSSGIATLLRQSILPWLAVMFVYLALWRLRREDGRIACSPGALAPLIVATAVIVGCIVPFTARNGRVYGSFLLLNSNAGYAMYAAQHPAHGTTFQKYWAAPLPADLATQGLNEAQWDRELMRRAIGFILEEPSRYLLLSLSRVRDYMEFWPTPDSSFLFNTGRVLSIGVFLPFMIGGLAFAGTRRGRQVFAGESSVFLALFIGFYSVLHLLTWAMPRYRLPVDAAALPFAALALCVLGLQLAGARRSARPAPA